MWKHIGNVLIMLLFTLPVLVAVVMPVAFAFQRDEYLRLEFTAVELTAYVTRVRENSNDDSPNDFTHYVSYEYNGVTYKDVRYDTEKRARALNTPVRIMVDPDNPAHLRPENPGVVISLLSVLLTGPMATLLLWLAAKLLTQRAVKQEHPALYLSSRVTEAIVLKDINLERNYAVKHVKLLFSLLAAVIAAACAVHQALRGTGSLMMALLPALVVPVIFLWLYVRHVDQPVEKIQLITSTHSKVTERDSDGDLVTRDDFTGALVTPGSSLNAIFVTNRRVSWEEVSAEQHEFIVAVTPKDMNIQRIFSPREFSI